jgi:alkanesulfonate monooxygenase SsuD/methylene tetrahydromethanopterin reductase-like flavin-dependent oxidoreductase (luciferase family)
LDVLQQVTATFREAAAAAGRDPATLMVAARANVPITSEPLGEGRPFLGGSPRQIADDLQRLQGSGVDHVFFSNTAAEDLGEQVSLLEQIQAAGGLEG